MATRSLKVFKKKINRGNKTSNFEDWVRKVKHAQQFYDQKKGSELREYRDAYEGKNLGSEINETNFLDGSVTNNMVYTAVSTQAPAISMSRPEVFVNSNKSTVTINGEEVDSSAAAARLKALLNFMWDRDIKSINLNFF